MEIITLFILGVSIGSYLNACIYRMPNNISLFESSFCPHCRKKLRWYELVPVLSYFAVRGRCLQCNGSISLGYPFVEIFTGTMTVTVISMQGISWETITLMFFLYGMVAIAVIDWKHLIIPDIILIVILCLGLCYFIIFAQYKILPALVSGVLSLIALMGIKIIGDWLLKKQTLGMGDIKLAGVLGFYLGWEIFLMVVWIASVMGSIFGIYQLSILNKSRDTKLPFGTFLAIVSSVTIVYKHDIEQFLFEWITLN